MIALRALGKAEIVTPTDKLTPTQEIVFAAALYLFLERTKPVTRAKLAELLWPAIDDSTRQHRLRQTILQLKHAGIPLDANRETISLQPDARESDLDVLFIHGAGDIDMVESLNFLPGYSPTFSRPFSDWIDAKRGEVSAASSRLLINEVRRARGRGDWLRLERLAIKCMEVDPFNEEAVLARAEASAMRGAKREAVSILDRYVADLGPGTTDLKLPANLMRKRIAERVPEAAFADRTMGIFVGRETDMQLLTVLLDDARAAQGRCCLIWGDPGIGKSRLAAELGRFGELQGVQMRRVACRRGDSQRPLSVFVEAVPQLAEMRGALGCSPDTLTDLKRLTQFDVKGEGKHAVEMDPQSIFELIRLAIFDLIDAVSEEQCLMLVVEDVQWLDAASARILGQLADWAANKQILLLFTSRTQENPLLEACTRAGLVTHHLLPISPEAATTLVSEMFEATNEKRDEEFLEWCRTVGDGNPFFLHELVKQWLETKQRHVVPPSITAVIRDRCSRLSAEATQLMQACSILGENSTLPRVERMLAQEPYMLLGALNELSKASMLSAERKPMTSTGDFRLAARHDLVSAVALEDLDPHARIFLHRRAGETLEAELGEGTQDTALLWACAQHWQKAGENERSYQIAKRYAEHLLEVGLPSDAADALIKLRGFCRTRAEELEVLDLAIPALELSHRWNDVSRIAGEIKSLQVSPEEHDEYELKTLSALWRASTDLEELLNKTLRCVRDDGASPSHRMSAASLAMKLASDAGERSVMDEVHAIALRLASEPAVPDLPLYELEVVFNSERGDVGRVVESARKLSSAARQTNNAFVLTRYFANCATALRLIGCTSEARSLLTESIEFALLHRSHILAKYQSLHLVRLQLSEGDYHGARATLDRLNEFEFPPEDRLSRAHFDYLNARVLLRENRAADARRAIEWLMLDRARFSIVLRGPIVATAILICVAQGDQTELGALVPELEQIHLKERAAGWNDFEAHALFVGLSALGEKQRARKLVNQYVKQYRRDTSPLPPYLVAIASSNP